MLDSIRETLLSRVAGGEYMPGQRLKTETAFAEEFGVTRARVRKTLRGLVDEGYLVCRGRNGYAVNHVKSENGTPNKNQITVGLLMAGTRRNGWNVGVAPWLLIKHAPVHGIVLEWIALDRPGYQDMEHALLDLVGTRRMPGAIVHLHHRIDWNRGFAAAAAARFPLVFRDHTPFPNIFSCVGTHHYDAGFLAARKLAERGCRKLLFVGYDEAFALSAAEKWRGFQDGCAFYHVETLAFHLPELKSEMLPPDVRSMLEQTGADGIFTSTSGHTEWFSRGLLAGNIVPGKSFRWIGMDAPQPQPGALPSLACVMQDHERENDELLRLTRELIDGRGLACRRHVLITPKFLEGETLS